MFANMAIQVLEHYKICSEKVQVILSLIIAVLAYVGLYLFVKISKIEVKNFYLNLGALCLVDVGSFAYIYYRKQKLRKSAEIKKENEELAKHAIEAENREKIQDDSNVETLISKKEDTNNDNEDFLPVKDENNTLEKKEENKEDEKEEKEFPNKVIENPKEDDNVTTEKGQLIEE